MPLPYNCGINFVWDVFLHVYKIMCYISPRILKYFVEKSSVLLRVLQNKILAPKEKYCDLIVLVSWIAYVI